jgi:hypothetical protein
MLDQIYDASEPGWSGTTSIVDTLLQARWCEERDLLRAFQTLQSETIDSVIVFFQLPSVMKLPEEWIEIKTKYTSPRICFRPIGTAGNELDPTRDFSVGQRTSYKELEPLMNASLPSDEYGSLVRTQVMVLYPLWGSRQPFYKHYLAMIKSDAQLKRVIVDASESWHNKKRPLTSLDYEVDLARKLRTEILTVLERFIPTYAVACKDPYIEIPKYLPSFFVMMKSGRLVTLGPGTSIVAHRARPFRFMDYSEGLCRLKELLESGSKHTVYEEYLLEAIREVDRGAFNLAVVQAVIS